MRRAPRDIAEALREAAAESRYVESVEIAGPGFLNLRVSAAWYAAAVQAALQDGFGGGTAERSLKINVEYVSANPTGRLDDRLGQERGLRRLAGPAVRVRPRGS